MIDIKFLLKCHFRKFTCHYSYTGKVKLIKITILLIVLSYTCFCCSYKKKPALHPPGTSSQRFSDTAQNENLRSVAHYRDQFERSELAKHWSFFKQHLRNEIQALPEPANEIAVGQSKIGGQPDLPPTIEWFKEDNGKRLSFVAQINLTEVAAYDKSNQLPSQGILYFLFCRTGGMGI